MKFFGALLSFLLITGHPLFASTGGKGGDGHVASFVGTARSLGDWLKNNGQKLNPPLDGNKFLKRIDPKKIHSQDESLYYMGFEVDAKYDASTDLITINRGRWDSDTEDEQWKTACHEIGRRMKIEGDDYEFCWQVVKAAAKDGAICKNSFCNTQALSYPPNPNILVVRVDHETQASRTFSETLSYSYIGPFAPIRKVLAKRSQDWATEWPQNPDNFCGILTWWKGSLRLKAGAHFTEVRDVQISKTSCRVEKGKYADGRPNWEPVCDTPVSGTCVVPIDSVTSQGLTLSLGSK